jgi:hypothetical protein
MKDTSNVLSLISPHDENYVRIRQATKQGYILCPIQGESVTWLFQILN